MKRNLIILLLALILIALAVVSYRLYQLQKAIENNEANMRAYLETLK